MLNRTLGPPAPPKTTLVTRAAPGSGLPFSTKPSIATNSAAKQSLINAAGAPTSNGSPSTRYTHAVYTEAKHPSTAPLLPMLHPPQQEYIASPPCAKVLLKSRVQAIPAYAA